MAFVPHLICVPRSIFESIKMRNLFNSKREREREGVREAAWCDIAPGPKVDGGAKSWQKGREGIERGRGTASKAPKGICGGEDI